MAREANFAVVSHARYTNDCGGMFMRKQGMQDPASHNTKLDTPTAVITTPPSNSAGTGTQCKQ